MSLSLSFQYTQARLMEALDELKDEFRLPKGMLPTTRSTHQNTIRFVATTPREQIDVQVRDIAHDLRSTCREDNLYFWFTNISECWEEDEAGQVSVVCKVYLPNRDKVVRLE